MPHRNISRQQAILQGRQSHRLGEFLIQAGVVSPEGIERALAVQRTSGGRLGSILVTLMLCSDDQIRSALSNLLNIDVVSLDELAPDEDLINLLSVDLIRKHQVIPLKLAENKLWIAMVDPYNLIALDDIRFRAEIPRLAVATCTERDFKRFVELHLDSRGLLNEVLRGGAAYNNAIQQLKLDETDDEGEEKDKAIAFELRAASNASPVVTLCNYLLVEAIREGASDIHIEPYETSLHVRMRIDGRLRRVFDPPKNLHAAVIARFKVMGAMDITKRRTPQDGQLSVSHNGETIHFRVSTLPTIFGEKCVIRLLKKDVVLLALDRLGFEPADLVIYKKALAMPQGLILVTGPTGSGKTTTLHAGLNHINHPEINIVTLEDPVEVTFPGICHVPISQIGGVSFAGGLRSILRQDPDVIFVGEMRDSEVASIAMRAAQTGHLVLSTLHTNSAAETVTRLVDMGIPPYLLAGSLLAVVAQRLVRRVCPACATPAVLTAEDVALLRIAPERLAGATPRVGRGCSSCNKTGYRGRVAVYEMLAVTPPLRELIRGGAASDAIMACASANGTRSLFDAGIDRLLRGETTAAEVRRVLLTD